MARFLVDTDVLIDHFRAMRRIPVPPQDAAYSVVTRAELYAGRGTDESVVDRLLSLFEEIDVDRAIAEDAGRLRRTIGIPMADALIAATATATRTILVTRNTRDFARVAGLTVHDASEV